MQRILERSRLPVIHGGAATWALSSRFPIAVSAQQWTHPRVLHNLSADDKMVDWSGNELRLHWSYFMQLDPDVVLEVLERLTLPAYAD